MCGYLKIDKNEQKNDCSEINHWQNSFFLLSRILLTILLLNICIFLSKIIVLLLYGEDKVEI